MTVVAQHEYSNLSTSKSSYPQRTHDTQMSSLYYYRAALPFHPSSPTHPLLTPFHISLPSHPLLLHLFSCLIPHPSFSILPSPLPLQVGKTSLFSRYWTSSLLILYSPILSSLTRWLYLHETFFISPYDSHYYSANLASLFICHAVSLNTAATVALNSMIASPVGIVHQLKVQRHFHH